MNKNPNDCYYLDITEEIQRKALQSNEHPIDIAIQTQVNFPFTAFYFKQIPDRQTLMFDFRLKNGKEYTYESPKKAYVFLLRFAKYNRVLSPVRFSICKCSENYLMAMRLLGIFYKSEPTYYQKKHGLAP